MLPDKGGGGGHRGSGVHCLKAELFGSGSPCKSSFTKDQETFDDAAIVGLDIRRAGPCRCGRTIMRVSTHSINIDQGGVAYVA